MKKVIVVGLFVNAALLGGRFWQEMNVDAQVGGGATVSPCDTDQTKYSLDTNDDGGIDLSDFVYGLSWFFSGGPAPQVCLSGAFPDQDEDGFTADIDCNDGDDSIHPGAPELCDGINNDCDDLTDEDFTLGPCMVGVGVCAAAGVFVCNAEGEVVCSAVPGEPSQEMCDGFDNDCDGIIDEDFPGRGGPCVVGVGACLSSGVLVCSPAGDALECSAVAGNPGMEVCNGLDDDCDGAVDNNLFDAQPCPLQLGVCAGSLPSCLGAQGYSACTCGEYGPNYEVDEISCDGLDNDCDGQIDEHPNCP